MSLKKVPWRWVFLFPSLQRRHPNRENFFRNGGWQHGSKKRSAFIQQAIWKETFKEMYHQTTINLFSHALRADFESQAQEAIENTRKNNFKELNLKLRLADMNLWENALSWTSTASYLFSSFLDRGFHIKWTLTSIVRCGGAETAKRRTMTTHKKEA